MSRVHFLLMEGGSPVQFTLDEDARGTCHACRSIEDPRGNLIHQHQCEAARAAVARDAQDITTDGAAAFVGAMRAQLAEEHADQVLGDQDDPRRRADLIRAYLAGYARAEESAVQIVRLGIERLGSEIAAWSGRTR